MSGSSYNQNRLSGCWFPYTGPDSNYPARKYLPQVDLSSHTNILATTSRTTLKQTFVNTEGAKLEEVHYTFPLYDGVSVVGFTCTVGSQTIVGRVKERNQAKIEFKEAVARGETAGLLEQIPEASDVFTTSIGNVPPNEKVLVEIIYIGELKHDAETDGSRFTIPTIIAPRYGSVLRESASTQAKKGRISISIDVTLDEGSAVRGLQSPSHPIAVTIGRTSTMDEDSFNNNYASATLTLGTTELNQDFVVVVLAKGTETPRAFLEAHPTIPNQRALMTTLVPKFNLPNISPEIVFIVDRSGSMGGKIELVVTAMKVFLKSLPLGVKFNICSFGSRHQFLFPKSKTYDQSSLQRALQHVESFSANFGGTEMLRPIKATVEGRYKDLPLEVMLLTDGEIWNQDEVFNFINDTSNARFFTLGIGHGASSSLVEGIARAGNGFAQWVNDNEKMDKRVVRMLKGALTPHITDYSLEATYVEEGPAAGDDDFEIIDSIAKDAPKSLVTNLHKPVEKKPISLFDANATEEPTNPPAGRYDNLPDIPIPHIIQAPHKIPSLFPFNRTTVYLLLGPDAPRRPLKSVTLRGTSDHGPLELEIPVQDVGIGETIHQLAARKAAHELEQGRGWITEARDSQNKVLKSTHQGNWDRIVEREAVRLGVLFQIGGKWCSFVAVDKNSQSDETFTAPAYSEKRAYPPVRSAQPPLSKFSFSAHSPAPGPKPQAMLFGNASGGRSGFGGSTSPDSFSFLASTSNPPADSSAKAARNSLLSRSRNAMVGYAMPSALSLPAAPPPPASAPAPAIRDAGEAFEYLDFAADVAREAEPIPRCSDVPRPKKSKKPSPSISRRGGDGGWGDDFDAAASTEGGADSNQAADASSLPATEKMHLLIELQQFDGSWTPSPKFFHLTGVTDARFRELRIRSDESISATALAIAWLKLKIPAEKDVWEMVVEKAISWLTSKVDGGEAEVQKLIDAAGGIY